LKSLLLNGFWTKLPPNPTRLTNVLGSFAPNLNLNLKNKVMTILGHALNAEKRTLGRGAGDRPLLRQ
jgi:hypothetical protein